MGDGDSSHEADLPGPGVDGGCNTPQERSAAPVWNPSTAL